MSALHTKLRRDLWSMRGQVLTTALVVACGIAAYVTGITCHDTLVASRTAFYERARFADAFAQLERAPLSLLERVRAVPGVAAVQGDAVGEAKLEIEGYSEPVLGHFASLDRSGDELLDALVIRAGRAPDPASSDEVVLSEMFADAHHLKPGDSFIAVLNGRRARLRISGIALSPEFVWAIAPGGMGFDNLRYGVVWMNRRPLSAAFGLDGAFDQLALRLAPGASAESIAPAIDRILEPYGGRGTYGRELQPSHQMVSQELGQLRNMAYALPPIFLGVAAFLLNLILSRVVGLQREQIATLKAVGYSRRALGAHFLELALAICTLGAALGFALGAYGGRTYTQMYADYFRFPSMVYRFDAASASVAAAIGTLAGAAGALFSVRRVLALAPAEAMRPEAPPMYRPSFLERLGIHRALPPSLRMVLRDLERRPLRAALSVAAVAVSTAIVVAGGMAFESIELLMNLQYQRMQREDVGVGFVRALPARSVRELERVPGVWRAEPERMVPVRLRHEHRWRETALYGLPADGQLRQLLDARYLPLRPPRHGVALSRPLATRLGLKAGDTVEIEVLQGERAHVHARVAFLADDLLGVAGYMDLDELGRTLREPDRAEGALLQVEPGRTDEVMHRLTELPNVVRISRPAQERAAFATQLAKTFLLMQVLLTSFAAAIAVAVVYNNARIALAVRSRDLATLRILGFTRSEVANMLAAEQAAHLGAGIPLGLPLGAWLGALTERMVDPELFRIPLTVGARTFTFAAAVVLLGALLSGLIVRRRAFQLDLISVLKARD